MFGRRSVPRLFVLFAAVAALMLASATSAFARPAGPDAPIMSFGELRAALTGGPLEGYMRTVVGNRTGDSSDITTIKLTVTGVPKTGGPNDNLIMFESTDTLIAKYGGVVAGMSGSPVYVHTAEGDKLVGAVSYGDYFTLGGTGLATPIESMALLETSYPAPEVVQLSKPILTSNGVFNKIIVAPNPQDYAGASAAGAFVAKPLASMFIGGLKPSSSGYKALAKDFDARGIKIVPLEAPLASGSGAGDAFSTEMTAGASVAALASRGDVWVGGIGTITYVDGDNVLAFGHPAYWSGATSLYMANAWIEGVWPSSYEPYKVGEPGAIRGAITQDRSAGIMGKINAFPEETTITATAINRDTGARTTSAVYVPRPLLANGFADSSLVGEAAYVAGAKLFDQNNTPGSAHTTTTVEVSDGTKTYDISILNYTDSAHDIAYDTTNDVTNAIESLQAVLGWGTERLSILSVNLTGEYSTHRTGAIIVGVEAPNGLHVGPNHIAVKALAYGILATQTVDTILTIPDGTAVGGAITAAAANGGGSSLSSIFTDSGISLSVNSSNGRETIAQIAGDLNKTLPNNTIVVTFMPSLSGSDAPGSSRMPSTDPIVLNVAAPWPVASQAGLGITTVHASVDPRIISWGDSADIAGQINGPSKSAVVSLYATVAGSSTESFVASQTAQSVEGSLQFDFPIDQAFTNTAYRVHVDGTDSWSGADATVSLYVRAITSFGVSSTHIRSRGSVVLSARLYPASSAGGTVVFEQLVDRSWRKLASKTLTASGAFARASLTWKPSRGTHKTRVRYLGGLHNSASTSGTKTISVR